MKFLCDNCKAKYQIADDKVAGKTESAVGGVKDTVRDAADKL